MNPYNSGVRHDYKESAGPARVQRVQRWLFFAAGLVLPLVVVSTFIGRDDAQHSLADDSPIVVGAKEIALALPSAVETKAPATQSALTRARIEPASPAPLPSENAAGEPAADGPEAHIIEAAGALISVVVASGDTLELLFRRNGLSLSDLAAMVALPDAAEDLKLLKPGDRIEIDAREGRVLALRRELDDIRMLTVARNGESFGAEIVERDVDLRITGAHGIIESSLFEDGNKSGLPDATIYRIYDIFKWDIDFALDVRVGDQFTVVYEELWRDGVKLRNGEIVAAEFVNQGTIVRAARYSDGTGHTDYYTPEGRSLKKAFLRAPLDFTRVSSNFNPNRRHPVLNTIRAHRGVDYAAPTGTRVNAAGDGRIIFRGVQGGYGNTVIVQHGGDVTTLYGHLSRFESNQRVGTRVKQGQAIGRVGMSGLATGPHLHYEYRVNGVHKNPRTVPLPAAEPVSAEYREDFRTATTALWRQLDSYRPATLASTAGAD